MALPEVITISDEEQKTNSELTSTLNDFMRDAFRAGLPTFKKNNTGRVILQKRSFLGRQFMPIIGWTFYEKPLDHFEIARTSPSKPISTFSTIHYVLNAEGKVGWTGRTPIGTYQELDGQRRFRDIGSSDLALEPSVSDLEAISEGRLEDTEVFLGYSALLNDLGIALSDVIPD